MRTHFATLLTFVAVLFFAGCATDDSLRESAARFTNENERTWAVDRRPDLSRERVEDGFAMFEQHRRTAAGQAEPKESGEALRATLLAQHRKQIQRWEDDAREFPVAFKKFRYEEFDSQANILRGK